MLSDVCMRFLRRATHSSDTLRGVHYAVLGLGDSNQMGAMWRQTSWASAADCNQAALKMDDWLAFLGGTRIVRRGEADERTDCREVQPWIDGFLIALAALDTTRPSEASTEPERTSGATSEPRQAEEPNLPSGDVAETTLTPGAPVDVAAVAVLAAGILAGCALLVWRRGRT